MRPVSTLILRALKFLLIVGGAFAVVYVALAAANLIGTP